MRHLLLIVIGLSGPGCVDSQDAGQTEYVRSTTVAQTTASQEPGSSATLNLAFGGVSCAATVECRDSYLYNPETLSATPTLTTGLACGHPLADPTVETLISFLSRTRCYQWGNPRDPATWLPLGGDPIDTEPWEFEAYSSSYRGGSEGYINTALALSAMRDFAFCHYEGLAVVDTARNDNTPRTASYRTWTRAVRWNAIIEADAYDCHLDGMSRVDRELVIGLAQATPEPADKASFPVTRDVLALHHAQIETPFRGNFVRHQAIRGIYGDDALFPANSETGVTELQTRDFWVTDPSTAAPGDIRARASCAEFDPETDELKRIGVLIAKAGAKTTLGAIVIEREVGRDPFECRRYPEGDCILYPEDQWRDITPCLLSAAPI